MGNLFDSDQTNELARLMSEQQKIKLREAIKSRLLEEAKKEEQSLNETVEPTPKTPEEDASGTGRYVKTMRDLAEKKNDNRQKVVREKTDLLAGDESVTAAQLRQSQNDLWQKVQTSLASLGGGGVGYMIQLPDLDKYPTDSTNRSLTYNLNTGEVVTQEGSKFITFDQDTQRFVWGAVDNITLDSDDLNAIVPGILDGLTTDEVEEGVINLYFTEQRVWNSITSADGIVNLSDSTGELYINIDALVDELNGDSGFEAALDSAIESFWSLKTTDSLPEGDINLYWTDARFDSAFNKAIDSALEDVFDSLSANFDSSLFDRITLSTTDSLPEGLVNLYWTDARFDSAFTEALGGQTFDSAVDSALLEIIKDSNSEILNRLTLETTDSLPEGVENLYYTKERVDSDIEAAFGGAGFDSTINGIFDSTSANFDSNLYNMLRPLENTDSLPEGTTNLYYTDERVEALVDSAYVNARVDLPETQVLSNTDSLPEGVTNLYYTQARVDSDINAALGGTGSIDSALTGIFDSDDPNFNPELWNKLTLNNTDSLPEGVENLYWTDDRFDSALKENLDSAVTEILQDSSSTIYQELTLDNTDSLPEGSTNLYYTDGRVEGVIDSYVDNAFLTGKIALDDLSDVTSPAPANNQYLQYNGANWAPADLDIDGAILFQGVVDATVDAAPVSPSNGHMYINTGSGAAVGSWTGLTSVDSDQQLIWGSDQASWFAFGGKHDPGVVEVREGIAILVNDSDAARPTVSVDKATTDTWYFTQDSVQIIVDLLQDSHNTILGGLQGSIDLLELNKVDRAGDTMTGDLTLPTDPTNPLHAATKQYVDAKIGPIDGGISVDSALENVDSDLTALNNTKVDRAGDTMTGDLTLPQDPTNPLHAATKQYVDAKIAEGSTDSSEVIDLIQNLIDSDDLVHIAGDTMTGFLTLHSDPADSMHAATKAYVDAQITALDSAMDSALDNKASATVDLTDVSETAPSHGQILMYDSDAGLYQPVDIEQAGGGVAHHDSVPPETPFVDGQFWFNTTTTSLYVWHVNAWVKIGL